MNKITKDNLEEFVNYYHEFNDSSITNINYDITNSKIELLINVFWSGKPFLKEDNTYETNKVKMKMIFNQVLEYSNKELFIWDDIEKIFLKYIKLNNKEFICFANSEKEPLIYIVCEYIEYEEIK